MSAKRPESLFDLSLPALDAAGMGKQDDYLLLKPGDEVEIASIGIPGAEGGGLEQDQGSVQ